ncbi:hypothetical protein MG290_02050 [Flavobacterium sp. CBA20B-1]|uniref:glycosyltransferase family 2 protein n=1 Tax=unclassified Flavobacterium TaxID=196869 RepID=UPI002223EFC4|nr:MULTISPECIES: hypothetical protein [unclassified Flavobacterium]WCM42476.1 hypothetical protein MG290_02050 [Flavobacterium sp. CBA20B-1]
MDVYIKSFNRPYLLHRTIASIYHFLQHFDARIVVLDDGTPQKYLDKIVNLFPEVEVVKSPYYNQKSAAISSNIVPEKVIPANFWRDEVLKGSEYFILLEDDMWFTTQINYKEFTKNVYDSKTDMIKFRWLKNSLLISENTVAENNYFNLVQPTVFTKNVFLFDAIFRTNFLKLGSITRRLVSFDNELLKYYQLYSVAGAVFSKRYYKVCWQQNQSAVDELNQIAQLLNSGISFNVGHSKQEILKATYKTTATLMSKENLGETVDIFLVNRILNEAWYHEKTYDIDAFSSDLPSAWIENNLADEALIVNWQNWYRVFKKSYTAIGCEI